MKYIFLIAILVISSCDTSEKTESILIGTKETEVIEIKNFSDNLKAKLKDIEPIKEENS